MEPADLPGQRPGKMEFPGPERNCRCVWALGVLPTSCPSMEAGRGLEMLWGLAHGMDGVQGGAGCEAGVSHPWHQVS